MLVNYLIPAFLSFVLVLATFYDLRYHRIPNRLTYPSIAICLVFHSITNGTGGLIFSAGGLTVGIVFFLIPYLMGGMGAGDAKLMGVVGAALGMKGACVAFIFTALFGGGYALILLALNKRHPVEVIKDLLIRLHTCFMTKEFIPAGQVQAENVIKLSYGLAIALGTFNYMLFYLKSLSEI